eukprot:scaffold4498_cov119-Isochrysis_galbana.AAC.12
MNEHNDQQASEKVLNLVLLACKSLQAIRQFYARAVRPFILKKREGRGHHRTFVACRCSRDGAD